ncbi:MAG: hypothetical protein GY696_12120 [Gammaproteobacteria bacterium]|nr:hypothetical protein [Gammaproteobacteria bacterium]
MEQPRTVVVNNNVQVYLADVHNDNQPEHAPQQNPVPPAPPVANPIPQNQPNAPEGGQQVPEENQQNPAHPQLKLLSLNPFQPRPLR